MTHQQPRPMKLPPVLRQEPERPPTQLIQADEPLSWWCAAARDGFTALAAKEHQPRMNGSREARMKFGIVLG